MNQSQIKVEEAIEITSY